MSNNAMYCQYRSFLLTKMQREVLQWPRYVLHGLMQFLVLGYVAYVATCITCSGDYNIHVLVRGLMCKQQV